MKEEKWKGYQTLGFLHGFVAAISVIIVSELGDKTFFIAAIMAMRHSRLTIFVGAMGALASMTILSGKLSVFFFLYLLVASIILREDGMQIFLYETLPLCFENQPKLWFFFVCPTLFLITSPKHFPLFPLFVLTLVA